MEPLLTKKQTLARCQTPSGTLDAVTGRLNDLGHLPHPDPLAIWEEVLSLRHLTDDTVELLEAADANIVNAVPQLLDLAATALRLAHIIAKIDRDVGILPATAEGATKPNKKEIQA